jgi:ankyrin repeat protein
MAIVEKHLDMMEYLISQGADINEFSYSGKFTPLHTAAFHGNLPAVELLLKHGADINIKGGILPNLPITYAAASGNPDMVALFIKHGSDLNSYASDNSTKPTLFSAWTGSALFGSIINKDLATFKLLMDAGVDSNLKLTKAHIAAINGDLHELTTEQNADLNGTDILGIKPIHYAALLGNTNTIEAMIKLGINPNESMTVSTEDESTNFTVSPIHIASVMGSQDGIKALVGSGAQINHPNSEGQTALHMLGIWRAQGQTDTAKLLIKLGANVNAADKHGNTPLHGMVDQHNVDVFKVLLAHGANPKIKNHDGHTVFDLLDNALPHGGPKHTVDDINTMKGLISAGDHTVLPSSVKLSLSDVLTSHSDKIAGLDENTTIVNPLVSNLEHTAQIQPGLHLDSILHPQFVGTEI